MSRLATISRNDITYQLHFPPLPLQPLATTSLGVCRTEHARTYVSRQWHDR
ncbi:hypothetical protein BTHE_1951 [Bifidobacterium thermophilum]|nr:hypothetical protein BTHE_1951 [Bifidobacterium thermophilum]